MLNGLCGIAADQYSKLACTETFTTVGWLCDMNAVNILCDYGALWLIHRLHKEKAALRIAWKFMDS